jgi:menaquinone-dependent protoporphyrinogen IX oxidase
MVISNGSHEGIPEPVIPMRAIVVYSSKTGFVKRYAEWIAEEISAKAIPADDVKADDLSIYDTIVYGGGLYVGGINGIKLIKNNLDKLAGKRIAVFATGASPMRQETTDEVRDKNFTPEEQKRIGFFYLRGGFDYSKLSIKDKMLMTLLKKKLESKDERTEDEKGMLDAYDHPADFTDRENIRELVEYTKRA